MVASARIVADRRRRVDRPRRVGYKRLVPAASDLVRLTEWLISFAVAVLPESVKKRDRLAFFASPSAHVASGIAEVAVCAGLFIAGMISYVTAFSSGPGTTYLVHQPSLGYGDFFGMGALGFLSYLIRPTSLLLLYCFGEGILRALEAAVSERLLGLAIVSLPWRLVLRSRRAREHARMAALLGPARPDEIVVPEQSRSQLFEVYSCAAKPWSDYQVVVYRGRFFVLALRDLVPRGGHHAYRYQFHPLEEREVIRGAIVDLTPAPLPDGPGP
jgi:hypothetical protein